MSVRPIHTKQDYEAALRVVCAYFDSEPDPGSEEGERFDLLLALVEAYETQHFPFEHPQSLAERLAASPCSSEQWGRDAEFLEGAPVGRERL